MSSHEEGCMDKEKSSEYSVDEKVEVLEEKLKSLMCQLQAEHAVFERMVYKNKNQHRRCSYFQYLLKVRRDLKLLQTANLVELLDSCFNVISGKKPKQKVYLLESLKRKKSESEKPNFLERLLGVVRLLSQMTEPILKAACEISTLLARAFFMGFSVTILALLARLRVLIQQILLDVVSIFNVVSSISQNKQSVKIARNGVEVYREIYLKSEGYITLECIWKGDKFVLVEKMNKIEALPTQPSDVGEKFHTRNISVQYKTIESFLGEDKPSEADAMSDNPSKVDNQERVETCLRTEFNLASSSEITGENLRKNMHDNNGSSPIKKLEHLKPKSGSSNVAFVSVKRLTPETASNAVEPPLKRTTTSVENGGEDHFYDLLIGGSLKDSLF